MNLIDNMIGYLSPRKQLDRLKVRVQIAQLESFTHRGLFEAASRGRRTEGWVIANSSINVGSDRSLTTIRDRARYLSINNPYAKRGIKAIASHVVGQGIIPQVKRGDKGYETLLKAWADSSQCDAEGRHDLYGLQHIIMKTIAESGECLIRKRPRPLKDGLSVPLQLQVLEIDYLDSGKPGTRGGIEFDAKGRRMAYWLFEEHPLESSGFRNSRSVRVPASDILHPFETLRPGQIRGIPWLSPVIIRLKDFDEYEDAQLVRQKIAACLVGVIHDMEAMDDGFEKSKNSYEKFEPGSWEILPPGKTVTFSNPPGTQGYGEYTSQQLHAISAGLELPYEVLTGDYSHVNYSSARLAFQEFYKNIDHWRWHMLVPQVCQPIFRWFKEAAELTGKASGDAEASWAAPKREYVDPVKEVKAQIMAIRAGLTSLSEQLRQGGNDPLDVLTEIKNDYQFLRETGLILTTDGRNNIKESP